MSFQILVIGVVWHGRRANPFITTPSTALTRAELSALVFALKVSSSKSPFLE